MRVEEGVSLVWPREVNPPGAHGASAPKGVRGPEGGLRDKPAAALLLPQHRRCRLAAVIVSTKLHGQLFPHSNCANWDRYGALSDEDEEYNSDEEQHDEDSMEEDAICQFLYLTSWGWKSRWKIRDLLSDGRCGQAVLGFLSSTDVGRLVPPLGEGDAGSQASEWELREQREREEEREAEAEELGAAGELGHGEELPLLLPKPSFMASVDE